MRLLPERYKVITATVDKRAGEIGVVYQAAGFAYVGRMSSGKRTHVHHNSRTVSERQAGRLFGTRGRKALVKRGIHAVSVDRRERYFAFRGTKGERRALRAAIAHLVKPYPRRPDSVVELRAGGSVLDVKHDDAETIARALVANLPARRLRSLRNALAAIEQSAADTTNCNITVDARNHTRREIGLPALAKASAGR